MAKEKNNKKKKNNKTSLIKKIALWAFLIVVIVGMVFMYAITALAS